MVAYTIKRLLLAALVAVTVSFMSFMLLRLTGDPAAALAGENATESQIAFVREKYDLDKPLMVQYVGWMGITLTLGGCALAFAVVLAIPLGVLAAIRPNSWIDRTALTISVLGQAMPWFFFGLALIIVFGVMLRLLPVSGNATWRHFILPSVALGYYATPAFMRLTRSGMLEVLGSDYIRTARAKGLRAGSVLFKHALRNAIIPVVSLAAVQFGFMLGGSLVIETVFAINGVGYLGYQSIARADLPMVQAIVLMVSMFYVVLTFCADLLNAFLDPRIRVH
jgi:peptide/nickel transport system permease protein